MKDLAIYGAGGFGRETALLVQQINAISPRWKMKGFYDDGLKAGQTIDKWPVLGGINEVLQLTVDTDIVVAMADPVTRKSIVEKLNNKNLAFPTIIHPTCQTGDDNNQLGKGCILTAGTILTTGIKLNDFVIINLLSTLGHDVILGSFSTVMPGCSISGNVRIGECTMMGTGARILQNLTIGKNCKIGAGAVVTQSFIDDKTIVGVPAYEK